MYYEDGMCSVCTMMYGMCSMCAMMNGNAQYMYYDKWNVLHVVL